MKLKPEYIGQSIQRKIGKQLITFDTNQEKYWNIYYKLGFQDLFEDEVIEEPKPKKIKYKGVPDERDNSFNERNLDADQEENSQE